MLTVISKKDIHLIEYAYSIWIRIVHLFVDDNIWTNTFSKYYIYEKETHELIEVSEQINIDVIRSMCFSWTYYMYQQLSWIPIICSERIARISNDKYTTSLFLKEFQPRTVLLKDFLEKKKFQESFDKEVVLKPRAWKWWVWIIKTTQKKLLAEKEKYDSSSTDFIIQELINATWWYPWIADWIHDVRCWMVWDKIVYCEVRTPQNNDFRANNFLWGKSTFISVEQELPKDVKEIVSHIIKKLHPQPYDIYSIDFCYCSNKKKRFMIETNSAPWFSIEGKNNIIPFMFSELAKRSFK